MAEDARVDEGIQLAADVVGLSREPCREFADCPALGFEFETGLVDKGKEKELEALEIELEEHPTFDLECAELVHERESGGGVTILFGHNLIVFSRCFVPKKWCFLARAVSEKYASCMRGVCTQFEWYADS